MADISVILCTHNPRPDHLRRTLRALEGQTLPKHAWELVVVDNASSARVEDLYDLSWHPNARFVREETLGLSAARVTGIAHTDGELVVFLDDDNLPVPQYLEEASRLHRQYRHIGVFGAGRLVPEFEVQPPPELRPYLKLLALRSVPSAQWSNNAKDHESTPWGAGLCATRSIAQRYPEFIRSLQPAVLGRRGHELMSHDDDVFSWVAASSGIGFGVFPRLQITHLIPATRLTRGYMLRLLREHAFSGAVLAYLSSGTLPRRIDSVEHVRHILHGVRNGSFSMRCRRAAAMGEHRAAAFISAMKMKPASSKQTLAFRPPVRHRQADARPSALFRNQRLQW